jgi:nicotinamidase-related amidase
VPDSDRRDALLVVDMLNDYDHEDADALLDCVRERVPNIRRMIDAARESDDILLAYVNDCFGDWSANAPQLIQQARGGRAPDVVDPIAPLDADPFVIKARHSIFYQTQVEYMLRQEGVRRIVLVGQVTEQCILYSALDGYVRHFEVAVAPDAVAHIREDLAEAALRMMEVNMHAQLVPADASAFAAARS